MSLTLSSPAKINLFMRVLAKRADGYHDIATLMQAVDLCDTLTFSLASTDTLTCTDPNIPLNNHNLILKAAHLFRSKTGLSFGVKVNLEKRIPMEAGLGGGSSNAATTLWALNELTGKPATLEQLITWSGEIGSDITFFLSQGTAYCTGRGEIIKQLDRLRSRTNMWIIKPQKGLPTPEVFKQLKLDQCMQKNPNELCANFFNLEWDCCNDLEKPAYTILPLLKTLKENLLLQGFEHVCMTGSGSAFFCFGKEKPCLNEAAIYPASFVYRDYSDWYPLID